MDTSKEYIEMCRKAVEIQELWEIDFSDYTQEGRIVELLEYFSDNDTWEVKTEEEYGIKSEKLIWLPRQDQLQDMIYNEDNSNLKADKLDWLTFQWYQFCFNERTSDQWPWNVSNISMEQLWLAYIMHYKYQKKWTGTDWIETNTE